VLLRNSTQKNFIPHASIDLHVMKGKGEKRRGSISKSPETEPAMAARNEETARKERKS